MSDERVTDQVRSCAPATPDALDTIGALAIGGASVPMLLTRAMSDAALAVAESGAKGDKARVTLTLEFTPGRGPNALVCTHKLAFSHPTRHGKKAQESGAHCDVWVNTAGAVTTAPDVQTKFDF